MLVSKYARTFTGTPEQVSLARSRIWDYLADCPMADDVSLITCEFASNAVLHTLSCAGTFTVRCELFTTYVWIEVENEGSVWLRSEPDGRPHGLDIVGLLVGSGNWGVEPTGDGNTIVWARLELAEPRTGDLLNGSHDAEASAHTAHAPP